MTSHKLVWCFYSDVLFIIIFHVFNLYAVLHCEISAKLRFPATYILAIVAVMNFLFCAIVIHV